MPIWMHLRLMTPLVLLWTFWQSARGLSSELSTLSTLCLVWVVLWLWVQCNAMLYYVSLTLLLICIVSTLKQSARLSPPKCVGNL